MVLSDPKLCLSVNYLFVHWFAVRTSLKHLVGSIAGTFLTFCRPRGSEESSVFRPAIPNWLTRFRALAN